MMPHIMTNIGDTCELTLKDYWEMYRFIIANERGWECKGEGCPSSRPGCSKSCINTQQRTHICSTLRTYTRYVCLLQKSLGKKPICEISFGDIRYALERVQDKTRWADETMRTVQSCLSVIFRFAAVHGDAYNVLHYTSYRDSQSKATNANIQDLMSLISSKKPRDLIQSCLQDIQEKHTHRTKSLSIWQLEKLSQILREGITEDGRYCALAIMLYTGARPAEVRALQWGDLVPFLDHPDHLLLRLHRTLDPKGNPKQSMKTTNAYRSIPVHFELSQLLNDRYQSVQARLGRGVSSLINRPMDSEIAELPICCLGNNFHRYCRDYEVALLADYVFSQQLRLPQRDMYIYLLDSLIEQGNSKKTVSSGISEQDQQLTLYVLRRNFWTWLASSTRLTDFEKRYIMGHEMDLNSRNRRPEYNDENRLWGICQKIDRCVLSKELHQQSLYATPVKDQPIFIKDRGLIRINITKEMLMRGGTLSINVTATEVGDAIILKSLSPVRKLGGLTVSTDIISYPNISASDSGINCEYENWLAHQAPSRVSLDSNKTQNPDAPVSE